MTIVFELSIKEQFDRQIEALYDNGFGAEVLAKALAKIEALAKSHYLEVANSEKAGQLDPRLGIESGAMFADLTKPVLKNDRIILDTTLDYALQQETRLQVASGRSFLPPDDKVFEIIRDTIMELM